MDNILVDPLTEDEYAHCYKTLIDKSYDYNNIINLIKYEINVEKNTINILSIGSGTGELDKEIIKLLNYENINYYAIEPNNIHHKKLKENFENIKYNINIINDYFNTDFKLNLDVKFDYIFMTHCLYPMNNPIDDILYARTFLENSGKIIISHQSEVGSYSFINEFNNKYLFFKNKPIADHSFSGKYILKKIKENNIKYKVKTFENNVDISDIDDINIGHNIMSFYMQTNTKIIPHELYKNMLQNIKNKSRNNFFIHFDDLIIVY